MGQALHIRDSPDSAAFSRSLAAIDISVSARTDGRTTDQTEIWIASHLFATLANSGELTFPLSLERRDRPDLLLRQPDKLIGVEITEAITEEYAAFCALAEREFPNVMYALSHFRPGTKRKTVEDMRAILRGEISTNEGWIGESPEEFWAQKIADSVLRKAEKLSKPGFALFDENWLSIYDNLPLPHIDLSDGIAVLRSLLTAHWSENPSFQRVFVEHGPVIACITADSSNHMLLCDLWPREADDATTLKKDG